MACYYCDWNENLLPNDKTHASIVAGQSCLTTSATGPVTMHGDALDFITADGSTATMNASFTGVGTTLTCTFKITGKLTPTP
jgi:hypothetical protein